MGPWVAAGRAGWSAGAARGRALFCIPAKKLLRSRPLLAIRGAAAASQPPRPTRAPSGRTRVRGARRSLGGLDGVEVAEHVLEFCDVGGDLVGAGF